MAIQYKQDIIFASRAQALTCTVNCVGAMGKGLALEFRNRFPTLPQVYTGLCQDGTLTPGRPFSVGLKDVPQDIILFPTKGDWRYPSKIEWVELGIKSMVEKLQSGQWKYQSIAVPALGCGNGGLLWHDVKELMDVYFEQVPTTLFEVYPPMTE